MIRFGPAGCGDEFTEEGFSSIFDVPTWLKARGLNACEYSFGHGFQMNTSTAKEAGKLFEANDIKLSLHAPYYINFANPEEEMYQKSVGYIATSIKFIRAFGYADHIVFHPGSCGKQTRSDAVNLIKYRLQETFDKFEQDNLLDNIYICPETMGKPMQIGTYEE